MRNNSCSPHVLKTQKYRHFLLGLLAALAFFFATDCGSNTHATGERLYKKNCANCHLDGGQGLGGLIPPLAGADYLNLQRAQLPCILKNGISDTLLVNGKIYAENMPAAAELSDVDITNILNYVNQAWGNNYGVFQLDEVRDILKRCDSKPSNPQPPKPFQTVKPQ
jgi:mono/diheme cytochrome c family protein